MEENKDLRSLGEIERSLIKRYRKTIWAKFTKAINQYDLIQEEDKIGVAISGGKDSLLLAKLMQELHRHSKYDFDLAFIAMDPGYSQANRSRLEDHLAYLNIDTEIYKTDVFEVSEKISAKNPCYMCARMRRGSLYAKAKDMGCNKLALGHHFNDVIETTMLNVVMAGSFKTMLPKLRADNFEDMELIRPMYLIKEEAIIRWRDYAGLRPLDCACEVAAQKTSSTRYMVKYWIEKMKDYNDVADINIFHAAENINLDMVLGWEEDGEDFSFLDKY